MRTTTLWLLALAFGYTIHLQATYIIPDSLYAEEFQTECLRDSIVSYALTYIGVPYRYGGESPQGFDCSGFTKYVFEAFDICLNRSSRYQAKDGEPVRLEEVKKGDLLIFTGRNASTKIPGHVGIVISDPGEPIRFVHASSNSRSGGIRVSELDAWYEPRLLQSRDVLNL